MSHNFLSNSLPQVGKLIFGMTFLATAGSALAATLPLNYSTTAPTTPYVGVTTDSGTPTNATAGGTFNYGNSYGSLANTLYTPSTGTYAGINFNFYDDYVFTVTGSTVNSVSSTINLGSTFAIDNLQSRLYDVTGNSVPTLGAPAGCPGATPPCTLVEGWGTTNTVAVGGGATVSYSVLDTVSLNPGTYVLELRGTVIGSGGGSYSGVLNVAPVPIPAASWLMGSALLGIFGVRRRK